jgi:hypothetical protein
MPQGDRTTNSATAWLKKAGTTEPESTETSTPVGTTDAPATLTNATNATGPEDTAVFGQFTAAKPLPSREGRTAAAPAQLTPDQLAAANSILEAERAQVALNATTAAVSGTVASGKPTGSTPTPAPMPTTPLSMRPSWETPVSPQLALRNVAAAPLPIAHPEDVVDQQSGAAVDTSQTTRRLLSPKEEVRRTRARNEPKRPGFFRRPSVVVETPRPAAAPVNPATLPPPLVTYTDNIPTAPASDRSQHKNRRRAERAGISSGPANAMSMVIDPKSIKRQHRRDVAFIVPMFPAMLIAAVLTYAWYQAVVRLGGQLHWAPIFIGIAVGWTMKLGSPNKDFGRIATAVVITTTAMLVGVSALEKLYGHMGRAKDTILWSTLPELHDPFRMLDDFHTVFGRGLGVGFMLMLGPIIAGAVSSLDL